MDGSPHMGGTLGLIPGHSMPTVEGGRSPTVSPTLGSLNGLHAGPPLSSMPQHPYTVDAPVVPTPVSPAAPQVPTPSPATVASATTHLPPSSPAVSPNLQQPLPTISEEFTAPVSEAPPKASTLASEMQQATENAADESETMDTGDVRAGDADSSLGEDSELGVGSGPALGSLQSTGKPSIKKGPHTKESKDRLQAFYNSTIDSCNDLATAERMPVSHLFSLFNTELNFRDGDHEWNQFQHVKKLEYDYQTKAQQENGGAEPVPLADRDLVEEYRTYKERHKEDTLPHLRLERAEFESKLSTTITVRERRKAFNKFKKHLENEVTSLALSLKSSTPNECLAIVDPWC